MSHRLSRRDARRGGLVVEDLAGRVLAGPLVVVAGARLCSPQRRGGYRWEMSVTLALLADRAPALGREDKLRCFVVCPKLAWVFVAQGALPTPSDPRAGLLCDSHRNTRREGIGNRVRAPLMPRAARSGRGVGLQNVPSPCSRRRLCASPCVAGPASPPQASTSSGRRCDLSPRLAALSAASLPPRRIRCIWVSLASEFQQRCEDGCRSHVARGADGWEDTLSCILQVADEHEPVFHQLLLRSVDSTQLG